MNRRAVRFLANHRWKIAGSLFLAALILYGAGLAMFTVTEVIPEHEIPCDQTSGRRCWVGTIGPTTVYPLGPLGAALHAPVALLLWSGVLLMAVFGFHRILVEIVRRELARMTSEWPR